MRRMFATLKVVVKGDDWTSAFADLQDQTNTLSSEHTAGHFSIESETIVPMQMIQGGMRYPLIFRTCAFDA